MAFFLAKLRNKEKKIIIQNPVAESSFNAESNLIETPLPALYNRGIAKMLFLSICFSHSPL